MPWLSGMSYHQAGPKQEHLQRCSLCGREIAGMRAMLPPGMTPEEAMAEPWESFDEGAIVLEENDGEVPLSTITFKQVRDIDAVTEPIRFCNDLSPWPPSDESLH
jgi:hypothetical protein